MRKRKQNASRNKRIHPSPALETVNSGQVPVRRSLQVSREHGSKGSTGEPKSSPLEQLVFFVPTSEDEVGSSKGRSLEPSEKRSASVHLLNGSDLGLSERLEKREGGGSQNEAKERAR